MTEIYLIRHAQAEGNIYRMMQGRWDGDVTEKGRAQIDRLAERIKDLDIDAVYSSSLYRAMLTASAVTKYHPNLNIVPVDGLREIDVGPWTARFFGDVAYEMPRETELFMHDSEKWRIDGAETFPEAGERGLKALTEIAAAHEGQRVAVVSHGVTIRGMMSVITGIPLTDVERLPIFGNTSITVLYFADGRFSAGVRNDTQHLDAEEQWNNRLPALRGECADPALFESEYIDCYKDAWTFAHGSLKGFEARPYINAAKRHYFRDKGSIIRLFDGETEAGLLDMDPERGKPFGYGWISLLYLKPEYRSRGLGIQALARAIMFCEQRGLKTLRLNVAESNKNAVEFYTKWGFKLISSEYNGLGRLLLMEKTIERGNI